MWVKPMEPKTGVAFSPRIQFMNFTVRPSATSESSDTPTEDSFTKCSRTEAPLPPREVAECAQDIDLAQVWPEGFHEIKLGVC